MIYLPKTTGILELPSPSTALITSAHRNCAGRRLRDHATLDGNSRDTNGRNVSIVEKKRGTATSAGCLAIHIEALRSPGAEATGGASRLSGRTAVGGSVKGWEHRRF